MPRSIAGMLVALAALLAAGCEFPADPDATTTRVRGGELRLGIIAGHPPSAEETRAIEAVARRLDARIVERRGDAHRLLDDLEAGRLDMVAGALPEVTPFAERVALSNPVGHTSAQGEATRTAFALPQGENRFLLEVNAAISGGGR